MLRITTIVFMMAALFFTSCREEVDETIVETKIEHPNPGRVVMASVQGRVIDESGNGVEGAKVTLAGTIVNTDEYGFYLVRNVRTAERASLVTVVKNGFFKAYRNLSLEEGAIANIEFMLLERRLSASFEANQGMKIKHGKNEVVFTPNTIQDEFGNAYDGTVNTFIHYFDPTAEDFSSTIPGGLSAINANGEEKALESYAMLAVELEDGNGNPLNILKGEEASVTFAIPADLVASAPDEIPLWSLDKGLGMWIEEGSAQKVGNTYVGNVGHFSFWNCDDPYNLIDFKMKVTAQGSETPVYDFKVTLTVLPSNSGSEGSGRTDINGITRGKIPAGKKFHVVIEHDECGIVYEGEIGPYTNGPVCEEVKIDLSALEANRFQIRGKLEGCEREAVSNGYISIKFDNGETKSLVSDVDGYFSTLLYNCNDAKEITAKAYDIESLYTSEELIISIGKSVNFGNLTLCKDVSEFLFIRLETEFIYAYSAKGETSFDNGEYRTKLYFDEFGKMGNDCWDQGNKEGFYIEFVSDRLEPGSYSPEVTSGSEIFSSNTRFLAWGSEVKYEITEFGPVGGYIKGRIVGPSTSSFEVFEWCNSVFGKISTNTLEFNFSVLREK